MKISVARLHNDDDDNNYNNNHNHNNNNNNENKLKLSIALFPDVIKSTLQKSHKKLNTILNGITKKKLK